MAVFGGLKLIAGIEGAVEDQTAAQARAYEEAHDVFVALPGAEVILTQHAQVHIVAHIEGHAEFLAHGAGDVIIPPGQVGREEHDAPVLVDDAGGAGGDGVELAAVDAGFPDHLLHHVHDHLLHIRGALARALGALFQAIDDLVLLIEDGAKHLGAANIQTNVILFRHEHFLLYSLTKIFLSHARASRQSLASPGALVSAAGAGSGSARETFWALK